MKVPLVESPTPFTDWVRNGAKEDEWEQFLRDQEKKRRKKSKKDSELEKSLLEMYRDIEFYRV